MVTLGHFLDGILNFACRRIVLPLLCKTLSHDQMRLNILFVEFDCLNCILKCFIVVALDLPTSGSVRVVHALGIVNRLVGEREGEFNAYIYIFVG